MSYQNEAALAPTQSKERIVLLDSLRGIAVLGILIMNIPFFGLPDPAGYNPVALDEIGTINEKIFIVVNGYIDGTQRAMFSMLFGAGILLFISRLEARADGMKPADYFIRRQLWLVVFGLFNAYVLLWPGDILFQYGICGIILFTFRKMSVKGMLIAAVISLLLMTIRENIDLNRTKQIIYKGEKALSIPVAKRTVEQTDELAAMNKIKEENSPEFVKTEMARILKKMKGSFFDAYDYFKDLTYKIESYYVLIKIWDILIFMFLGMAFYKTGILTGTAPLKIYWWLLFIGLSFGGFLSWYYFKDVVRFQYNQFEIARNTSFKFYEIARVTRSLGFFALLLLLYKSGLVTWLFNLMKPVGQMAFTNYLTQSFFCNLLFLGAGFDMIGSFDRKGVYFFMLIVWIVQIIWSHLWLRYFRYGPLEWCWRSLTYWEIQSMRK
jgi:uncharacterized protein